ncbi:hypothetical protein AMATHDRAFT_151492 [Amanita thiersii Skay4041]|uniref:Ricin B lectin domain-containing protein n=1 Tax=Amanita thiersii Skay4041 TaxID=703135 RepID=A0A2A9NEE9_9AGAR|nr:hypothetical protein AMATHDRAFT_151492 [Amanita thiersii Skay4041]
MALRTGRYFIHNGTDLVGRNLREERFLRPKAICNKTNDAEPQWDIEVLRNGRYRMYAKGVPVGIQDGRVVALVLDIKEAEEWRIVQVPGPDRFR